jgi:hypothetical protein
MTATRIDKLRCLVANIGTKQSEYHNFFTAFATQLESELSEYMGCKDCVALCQPYGDFNFDQGSYHHAGLGFENGRYRIPIMLKVKNLQDEGDFIIRVRIYFTKTDNILHAQIWDESAVQFEETDFTTLCQYIYHCFLKIFSEPTLLEHHELDYQSTGIGFTAIKK